MPLETVPFDASPYLDDEPAQTEYLNDAFATGDASVISHALGVVARARGMTGVARDAGLQRENLYRALSAEGHPELSTITRVLSALGFRLNVRPTL